MHSEAQFDAWDLAFHATFAGVELEPEISDSLLAWLAEAQGTEGELVPVDMDWEELRRRFYARLKQQKERHDGGSHWVVTGGPWRVGHEPLHRARRRAAELGELRYPRGWQAAFEHLRKVEQQTPAAL